MPTWSVSAIEFVPRWRACGTCSRSPAGCPGRRPRCRRRSQGRQQFPTAPRAWRRGRSGGGDVCPPSRGGEKGRPGRAGTCWTRSGNPVRSAPPARDPHRRGTTAGRPPGGRRGSRRPRPSAPDGRGGPPSLSGTGSRLPGARGQAPAQPARGAARAGGVGPSMSMRITPTSEAKRAVLTAGAAVLAYRDRHGAWPDTLVQALPRPPVESVHRRATRVPPPGGGVRGGRPATRRVEPDRLPVPAATGAPAAATSSPRASAVTRSRAARHAASRQRTDTGGMCPGVG